ncbi:MAG: ankyrin repeat domain-containing protein [Vicinamibacterales bacterium]
MRRSSLARLGFVAILAACAQAGAVASSDRRVADAAMRGDRALVGSLVKAGADVNAAGGDGMTALHWAAMRDDIELARVLLQSGARVDAVTKIGGYTPLLVAARNGNASLVQALVTAGADPNSTTTNGTTPLMLAAASGDVDAVTRLLERGANLNAKESAKGQTALMFAAASNRDAVIRVLAARGADLTAATTVVDLATLNAPRAPLNAGRQDANRRLVATHGGLTALLFAARQGHVEAVRALLDAGAGVNQASPADNTTPLLIATINGHFDLAKLLLDAGADPKIANTAGATPLFTTLNVQWIPHAFYPQPTSQKQQTITYLELMQALLERGADPNARLRKKLWFTGYNFDLSDVDETGATPFWRAAQSTDLAAMRLLQEWGADPAISTIVPGRPRGGRGAVEEGQSPGGAAGAQSRARSIPPGGEPAVTALQVATGAGYDGNFAVNAPGSWMPAIRYLVEELGFDVNQRDHKGYTPLHYAAFRGDNEMILYLISRGADVTAVSKDGVTTADMANGPIARVLPFPETIALLEKLGSTNNHRCVPCGQGKERQ